MPINNYLNDFLEYNQSDEELEFFIRMNAEWNEDSFKKLCSIITSFFENCKDEKEIPKEIDYLFNSSISRIIGIISSPLFTNNNFIGLSSLEYKDFIQNRISVLNELKKTYENRIFLK